MRFCFLQEDGSEGHFGQGYFYLFDFCFNDFTNFCLIFCRTVAFCRTQAVFLSIFFLFNLLNLFLIFLVYFVGRLLLQDGFCRAVGCYGTDVLVVQPGYRLFRQLTSTNLSLIIFNFDLSYIFCFCYLLFYFLFLFLLFSCFLQGL